MSKVSDSPRPASCFVASCTVHDHWRRPVSVSRPAYAAASRVAS
jgi:hypothetical protein